LILGDPEQRNAEIHRGMRNDHLRLYFRGVDIRPTGKRKTPQD
jgi:hypothetical protein